MGKRIGVIASIAVLAVGISAAPSAQAADGVGAPVTLSIGPATPSPWTQEVGYTNQAVAKLKFGLKNALLGWTDLITEPQEASHSGEGFLKGLGFGVKDAVLNELGGVIHTVTFFLPQIDAPLPEGGTQILSS